MLLSVLLIVGMERACFVEGHRDSVASLYEESLEVSPEEAWSGLEPPRCIHDTPVIQRMISDGMDHIVPQQLKHSFEAQATGPIRIAISSLDLDSTSRYCDTVGESTPDFTGGTVTCTADDIFTVDKKTALLTQVIPRVITRLQTALSVNQISGNLMVGSTSMCSPFTIPAAHVNPGISNADFVLYVSAGPTTGSTAAWAGACQNDQNGRPIVGRANFGPKYLVWNDSQPLQQLSVINTVTHEILHALGISGNRFLNKSTISIRGKTATIVSSPTVLAKAREFLNCPTLQGMEVEDEGGAGSAGSHWERRIVRDEIMCGSGGPALSPITLACLQDSGNYIVNWTAAEAMAFGKDAGCDYVNFMCNTTQGGAGKWFCFDSGDSCVFDNTGFGPCSISTYTDPFPSYFQYFSDPRRGGSVFMDGCPVRFAYSNRICNVNMAMDSTDTAIGRFWGNGSRCFNTTGLKQTGVGFGGSTLRCLQASCTAGQISVRVGTSGWVNCPADGSAALINPPSGWDGQIVCPVSQTFCDSNISTPTAAPPVTPAPSSTAAPSTATTTTTQAVTTTTTTTTTTTAGPSGTTAAPQATTGSPTVGGTTASPGAQNGTTSAPGNSTTATPTTTVGTPPVPGSIPTAAPTTTSAAFTTTQVPLATRPPPPPPTSQPASTSQSTGSPIGAPTVTGQVKLRGTRFDSLLSGSVSRSQLTSAVQRDISNILSISIQFVRVDKLSLGSLIVDYSILSGSGVSANTVNTKMSTEVGATSNNFTVTQSLYSSVSTESIVVESSTAQNAGLKSDSLCGTNLPGTDCLVALFVGIALFVVFLVIGIVCFVRARNRAADREKAVKKVHIHGSEPTHVPH